jgi:DNA polymerase-3 subunit delta'
MLPTVRSRVRKVALRVPAVEVVADLLQRRHGIDKELATECAREAQSHIGMASRLAVSAEARERRAKTLEAASSITDLGTALAAAELWLELAKSDAGAMTEELDAAERAKLLKGYGLEPDAEIPKGLRPQLKRLEEAQKRRATRSLRDGLDRVFVDLLSLYRDVLTLQLASGANLINLSRKATVEAMAKRSNAAATIAKIDALTEARERIAGNVRDILALEALATELI